MKKIINSVIAILVSSFVYGQSFIAPVKQLKTAQKCKIELLNGTLVEGSVRSAVISGGGVKVISIKVNGEKRKYKAEQIKRLKVKAGFLMKMDMIADNSKSIRQLAGADFNEIVEREYIIYEQALLSSKRKKYRLLQLLNPGFDHKIKVFHNPNAQQTGSLLNEGSLAKSILGGKDKSFFVSKEGAEVEEIKKGKYKKQFPRLFGDCNLKKAMKSSKIKFKNFASHVFLYDQICGKKK